MERSTTRRLAPGPALVLVVCALFAAATPVLRTMVSDPREDVAASVGTLAVTALLMTTWAVIGALAATRLPRNPLGWLFLVAGVVFCVGPFFDLYAGGVPDGGGGLPGRTYAAWASGFLIQSPAIFGLFALILLHFPDGRPCSPRWRPLVRAVAVAVPVYTLFVAFKPGKVAESHPPTENPFGVAALEAVWPVVDLGLAALFLIGAIAGLASMVIRFRRSGGVERQQLKWLAAGAGTLVLVILSGPLYFWTDPSRNAAWHVVFVSALTLLPLTAGVAILRYHLFDLGRIVSRTLSYAIVVGILGLGYVGVALGIQTVAGPALGDGDLPVALSTLAAAAAFRPLHGRVRRIVDRRFNRRVYDAEVALAAFSGRVRDELDLSTAGHAIEDIVRSTLEPSSVRVWVHPAGDGLRSPASG